MNNTSDNTTNITTALSKKGLSDQPWWVEQWLELINSYRFKKRLERAWNYARKGNVISIRFEGRCVHARVQGTDEEPYKVKLWLDVLTDEDWGYVIEALAQKAKWSAQLLAGIMPRDIERAFAASGRRLFPFSLQEIYSECSCPDIANPCKHISAVYFLMGDRFSEDPFVLFQLRGRHKNQLLEELAKLRQELLEDIKQSKLKNKHTNANQSKMKNTIKNRSTFMNPHSWWEYQGFLNSDLVVITPNLENDNGINSAGELPLAEDPKFPKSKDKFIDHLNQQGLAFSQQSSLQAMKSGQEVE